MWTTAKLLSVEVPKGKTKATMTDPQTRGLVYEVRPAGRSFYLRYTFEGRQRTIPLGPFPTLSIKDARKKAEELKRRVLMGKDPLGEKHQKTHSPTIREFFTTVYLPYSKNQHRDPYGNQSIFVHHLEPRFGSKRMNEISRLMVRNWINDLLGKEYSASFINRCLVLLGNLYTIANDLGVEGVPQRSELRIKRLKVVQKHTTHLSSEEVQRLALALEQSGNLRLKYIVSFLLMTGARRSEALHAKWEHIDYNSKTWLVPLAKSGQPRHIYLSDAAITVLDRLRSEAFSDHNNPYIFPNPNTGRPYKCLYAAWKLVRTAAGLPDLRLHDLRHSYASTLVNNGVSLYDVQKLLGHSSITTTQRYAHLSSERLFQSVAVADGTYGKALGITSADSMRVIDG